MSMFEAAWRSRGRDRQLAQPACSRRVSQALGRSFLEVLGLSDLAPTMRVFWSKGGPHWDALAVVSRPAAAPGVLLVEAKAHLSELLNGSPIGATVAEGSRQHIELAMAWASMFRPQPRPSRRRRSLKRIGFWD